MMDVRFGVNPIGWSNDDDRSLGGHIPLERCLAQAHEAGYDGVEKGHKMPTDPDELRAVLAPHDLAFVSGWHSLGLLGHDIAAERASIDPHIDLLLAMECEVCIVCETTGTVHGTRGAALGPSAGAGTGGITCMCTE